MENLRRILIVDDSEIDRVVLRNMLNKEFQVVEVDNGYSALDVILKKGEDFFDAVLLDVSMPLFDGLTVLRILRENNLHDVQIFIITSEATKENIEKASQYNIAEFIKKPFNREEVLKRLRTKLGVARKTGFSKTEMDETRKYISDLEFIYNRYLGLSKKDKTLDERRAYFMRVLLDKSPDIELKTEAGKFKMEIICKSAYLCNIGNMLLQYLPDKIRPADQSVYQQHPVMGADMLRLNYSKNCRQFVEICAEICLHHHERIDGQGFPHGVAGYRISEYAQICGLLEKFENLFFRFGVHNITKFDNAVDQLNEDSGFVSSNVLMLLVESRSEFVKFYN